MQDDAVYGEVPFDTFVETFIPRHTLKTIKNAVTPRLDCKKIPISDTPLDGSEMQVAFAQSIKKSSLCASFFVEQRCNFKQDEDVDDEDRIMAKYGLFRRRTITRIQKHLNEGNFMEEIDLPIDMRPQECLDPWDLALDNADPDSMDEQKRRAWHDLRWERQQYLYCTSQIMSLQHRTHVFSISMVGPTVRLLRWDRAGVIVSEAFDYSQDSTSLAEFLLRYEHASPEQRGHDISATEATSKEVKCLLKGAGAFLRTPMAQESRTGLRKSIKRAARTYKLRVPLCSTGPTSAECEEYAEYIVRRPFFDAGGPFGRATRGYIAWSCTDEKVVFLKDAWKSVDGTILPEAEVFQCLRTHEVPHVPIVQSAGYVLDSTLDTQTTRSHRFRSEELSWESPAESEVRMHHRLAQDWTMSLCMAKNSKQVVEAVRNVLVAIRSAHQGGKIIHRDISTGNIMLNENFEGLLSDWDMAAYVCPRVEKAPGRAGTWAFSSVNLLQSPTQAHTVADDVESCFYVLWHEALNNFKMIPHRCAWDEDAVEDHYFLQESTRVGPTGKPVRYGGKFKLRFFTEKDIFSKVKFESEPLTRVIQAFAKVLSVLYRSKYVTAEQREKLSEEDIEHMCDEHEETYQKLCDVTSIIEIFEEAIGSSDWPGHDDVTSDAWAITDDEEQAQSEDKTHEEDVGTEVADRAKPKGKATKPSATKKSKRSDVENKEPVVLEEKANAEKPVRRRGKPRRE